MNQHRWTCLTTLVLTAVIAPITSVYSKTLPSPVVKPVDNYSPLSPQSLPTITPLVVTELQTEAAIPAVIQLVPQVSKLPIVTKIAFKTKPQAVSKQHRAAKIVSIPRKNIQPQFPAVELPIKTALFNPQSQITKAILAVANPVANPIAASPAVVNAVIPLPSSISIPVAAPKPTAFTPFITKTASAQIPVVRSVIENRALSSRVETLPPTVINSSATVQAEIADSPSTINTPGKINSTGDRVATVGTAIDRIENTSAPQVAPIVSNTPSSHSEGLRQRSDLPSFESGLPVFVFDNERPQQIVATAIAQVGETIVAPEPSIAIPVERPKQLIIPSQLPVTTAPVIRSIPTVTTAPATPAVPVIRSIPTVTAVPAVPPLKPQGTGIVKIEQPSETVRPALDKIVATQSGQASWYGSEGGSRTANGERYYPEGLTAAHRTLPFGTKVRVTSIKTGKTVTVRINDRGPFHGRRIIDVSAGAARVIGLKSDGVGAVRMDILAKEKSGQE